MADQLSALTARAFGAVKADYEVKMKQANFSVNLQKHAVCQTVLLK